LLELYGAIFLLFRLTDIGSKSLKCPLDDEQFFACVGYFV